VFDVQGNFIARVGSDGALNAPWGLAQAPASFGAFAGDLLVGNFGDGRINVFDPVTDAFLGQLLGTDGLPLVIDGLWGLMPGSGAGSGGSASSIYFFGWPRRRKARGVRCAGSGKDPGLAQFPSLRPSSCLVFRWLHSASSPQAVALWRRQRTADGGLPAESTLVGASLHVAYRDARVVHGDPSNDRPRLRDDDVALVRSIPGACRCTSSRSSLSANPLA
jgi:hypothetical protein